MSDFGIIALTHAASVSEDAARTIDRAAIANNAAIALSACRAGETGIINIEFASLTDRESLKDLQDAIGQLRENAGARSGIKCDITQIEQLEQLFAALSKYSEDNEAAARVILALSRGTTEETLRRAVRVLQRNKLYVLVEATTLQEALLAQTCGAQAVIAKGHEAAGRISDQTAFVLFQECIQAVKIPVWVQGGIGLHTASACFAGGAAGVVLDSQLLLTAESSLPLSMQQRIATLDGTETTIIGDVERDAYRVYLRHAVSEDAAEHPAHTTVAGETKDARKAVIAKAVETSSKRALDRLWVLGQDVSFAADLARRFGTVPGIIKGIKTAVVEHARQAASLQPLGKGSALAQSHKTEYPLVQGAMTRVSDTAEFARAVGEGGALPFLALALMRGNEIEPLLAATAQQLGSRAWGVGILGFVPHQLRQEQLEVVRKYKPPFALIAGGRPDQAKALEEIGIQTYLHVPSPMLLESFIEMGSRRFIFEGKECGGHVGPRSSFVLWETMVEKLLIAIGTKDDASAYHVLFAGGVHDGLSGAMVAALAAPLAARGVRVGGLMGTAYLFTKEAVETGAIVRKFQQAAVECRQTVLLETGPGHAIRCINSPYKRSFDEKRTELTVQNKTRDQIREELELMNLGRLRIASKGLARPSAANREQAIAEFTKDASGASTPQDKLSSVAEDRQWSEGMYMIGQVASMHDSVCTIAELHESVCDGSRKQLDLAAKRAAAVDATITGARKQGSEPIAIIGMSCLFPKAGDVETYWHNILNKVDAITEIPEGHFDWKNYYDKDPLARDRIFSKWGGFLDDVKFDPTRYGIPPSSLASIDPMQLMILDVVRTAIEDAGYVERGFERERTSVVLANAGHGPITALYSLRSMLGWKLAALDESAKDHIADILPEWTEDSFPGYLGNVTAGRVANRYDLGGINFSIDAACASSLAALYVGMAELRNGNSDVVLVAATDTHNQPGDYLSFSKTHALSGDGHCKTFDAQADGIVISEGMAILVIKRLSDAERDGDKIYAVIRGIGGSSDGRDLSLTAPRPAGQMLALNRAYEDAGVSPSTVTLIEAHGTGTVAGDKAEIEALKQVFDRSGAAPRGCAVGSVKTMIGHTKCAAGLASLIKVAKALHHKVLPPTIGVKTPNPACNFETSPFYINSEVRPWINPVSHAGDDGEPLHPRRAGVSAFGFGGTNFHTVVEEYIPSANFNEKSASKRWPCELFVLKSRSRADLVRAIDALSEQTKRWSKTGDASPDHLRNLAYTHFTKQAERGHDDAKDQATLSLVANSLDDLLEKLAKAKQELSDETKTEIRDPRGIYFADQNNDKHSAIGSGKVAFLFSGQGSQYVDMARELAVEFAPVRETLELANATLRTKLPKLLSNYIYPPPAFSDAEKSAQQQALTDTRIAQPAVGAIDIAVFKVLRRFGLKPNMVAGHSYGEYAALAAAGAITEEELYRISEKRGEILAHENGDGRGSMAALSCPRSVAEKIISHCPGIVLANINSPVQCVASGGASKIKELLELAKAAGIQAREIAVSQAFHSPHMAHSQRPLKDALSQLKVKAPSIPVYSNLDGQPHPQNGSQIIDRLTEHVVKPVDFVEEVRQMQKDGATIFVEVGPGTVLSGLADAILQQAGAPYMVLSVDRAGRNGIVQLMHTLGQLAAYGKGLDLEPLFAGRMTAADCLSLKQPTTTESTGKRSLTYLINSVRIERLDSNKTLQAATAKVTAQKNSEKHRPQTGAQVSAHLKPTSATPKAPEAKPPAPAGQPAGASATDRKAPAATGNGAIAPAAVAAPVQTQRQTLLPAQPAPAYNAPMLMPPATAGRNVDQVMLQFQQTMMQMTNSFLETQQRVMLAYLGGRSGAALAPVNTQLPFVDAAQYAPQHAVPQNYAGGNGHHPVEPLRPLAPIVQNVHRNGDHQELSLQLQDFSHDGNGNGNGHNGNGSAPHVVSEPAVVTEVAPQSPSEDGNEGGAEQLVAALLEIVSERTGYPAEMLDPSLDLEADLGIDSIKRVEILNSFRKLLPQAKQEQLEGGIEELAGTKTLQGIMDWIRSDGTGSDGTKEPAKPQSQTDANGRNGNKGHNGHGGNGAENAAALLHSLSTTANAAAPDDAPETVIAVRRGIVRTVELEPISDDSSRTWDGTLLIVDDGKGTAQSVSKELTSRGQDNLIVKHGAAGQYSCDLTDEEQVKKLASTILSKHPKIAGIVHLLSLNPEVGATLTPLYSLYQLSRVFEAQLNNKDRATTIVAAHALSGDFGHSGSANPLQAGLTGLLKSLAKEWSGATCKALDFEPEADKDTVASTVTAYILTATDRKNEIAIRGDQTLGLGIISSTLPEKPNAPTAAPVTPESVVLVTGGARGITADIAKELAGAFRPRIVLVGRSERPSESESAATAGLTSQKEIKAALIEELKEQKKPVNIAAVETQYQRLIRDREIRENLSALSELASAMEYHALDVRDEKQFGALIDQIYAKYGRLDGVIHGAGVIEDAYAKDKPLDSFRRVVETKVLGALTLSKKLRFDKLNFLFLFSSVVGRTGNAGQTDYVSANEIMNKLASQLNQKTAGRVASLMWGPWRGGMAQPELEEIFARYGWAMIDREDGKKAFLNELLYGKKEDVEVMLVGEVAHKPKPRGARIRASQARCVTPGTNEFILQMSVDEDLFLADHTFDNVPVMPMAVSLEMMVEAAMSAYPGWTLASVSNLDIPAGIVFESGSKTITVRLEELTRSETDVVLSAVLGIGSPLKRAHFRCEVRLMRVGSLSDLQTPAGISRHLASVDQLKQIPEAIAELPALEKIYGEWLFHGPLFQGIRSVDALGPSGVAGQIVPSDPGRCIRSADGQTWDVDPMLIDSAMQLAGVWARQYLEITALPTGFKTLTRYSATYSDKLYARVEINPGTTMSELSCDIAAYNEDGSLAFVMQRLGGVGSKSLNRLSNQVALGAAK